MSPPHSPLVYFAAAVVLYAICVAVFVLIRIWRRPKSEPAVLDVKIQIDTTDFRRSWEELARKFEQLGCAIRRSRSNWLSEDPPTWRFPTWRVVERPFDWRID